ncbi:MAG: hypothetical protein WB249_11950 [Candidatus Sulfotelmatobacter sp.]
MGNSQLVDGLLALKNRLQDTRDTAKRDFDESERRLQAVMTTLAVLMEEALPAPIVHVVDLEEERLIEELRTKHTQLQGLIAIAHRNKGVVSTKDAIRLLQRSGLMSPTKNASNILYNVINRSERFDQLGGGKYRLKTPANGGSVTLKAEELASGAPLAMFAPKPQFQ